MKELKFNINLHPLADEFKHNIKTRERNISLLSLSAYQLWKLVQKAGYFSRFIKKLDIPEKLLDVKKNPFALGLLEDVVYTSAVTGALYRDIGYPYQFLINIEKALSPLTKFDLLVGYFASNPAAVCSLPEPGLTRPQIGPGPDLV